MITFLAELSKRSGNFAATPSVRWSRRYNIYEIYIGPHPSGSYWTEVWGGWYDHTAYDKLELFMGGGWLIPAATEPGLTASIEGYAGLIFISGGYAFIHIHRHPWLYERSKVQLFSRTAYLSAPKNSADPADLYIDGAYCATRLEKPSVSVKLSDPVSGLTRYSTFNITLDNSDGAFDDEDIEDLFNTPAYIRKAVKDNAGYEDFIPLRAGFVEDVKSDSKKLEVSCADRFRVMDEPVCRTLRTEDYDTGGRWKDDATGKELPLLYGVCTVPLVEIVETAFTETEVDMDGDPETENSESQKQDAARLVLEGKYLAGEGAAALRAGRVTDPRALKSLGEAVGWWDYPLVYGADGTALPCAFDPASGIITVRIEQYRYTVKRIENGEPVYEDMERLPKPAYAVVTGITDNGSAIKCGNVLKSLISRSAYLDYNDSLFDTVETGAYIALPASKNGAWHKPGAVLPSYALNVKTVFPVSLAIEKLPRLIISIPISIS